MVTAQTVTDNLWSVRLRATYLAAAVICLAWLWLFRGPLLLGEVCALRDAGNFYYPLFTWQCEEWSAGRIPLWNPLDGLGVPALADGTSSVLYPGKLIFALPVSFELRFNLYLAAHVLLAACSVYCVARRWGASGIAAGVGAASYAFGGYVLFQTCNPVFLVSAAWLPVAAWLADGTLVERNPRRAVAGGAVLALMVLGGDPQTAYHAGLLACVYAVLLWRSERRARLAATATETPARCNRWFHSRPALLGLTASAAMGMSAVQVLPTWEWIRRSDRAQFEVPRSVYEIVAATLNRRERSAATPDVPKGMDAIRQGLFATPRTGSHAEQTYTYSLAPWRLFELLWPSVSGRVVPVHQRWIASVTAEGKVWTPTLYMGLIPLIAAIAACRGGDSGPRERWLKWMVLLGVLGSFGWYGLGWVLEEMRGAVAGRPSESPWVAQPVGGLYWLLVTGLPGYAYFRYPAKWFVVASLGVSLLAARGTDRILQGEPHSRRIAKWLCLASCGFTVVVLAVRQPFIHRFQGSSVSELYGPLDANGAWIGILTGGLQVAIVTVATWRLLLNDSWRRRFDPAPWLLLLTAADLLAANHWLIATVPDSTLKHDSSTARQVWSKLPARPDRPPARVLHEQVAPSTPARWKEQRSTARLAEIVIWEQNQLWYRHHLRFGVEVLDGPTTVRSADWMDFLRSARRLPVERGGEEQERTEFDWLGLDAWVCRPNATATNAEAKLIWNRHAWPRVWLQTGKDLPASPQHAAGECRILQYEPQRVEIAVSLDKPATLVLSDAFDPDWVATRFDPASAAELPSAKPIAVKRVRSLVRGVDLPAGAQLVEFRYRPRSFYWGATISLCSLVILGSLSWRPKRLRRI